MLTVQLRCPYCKTVFDFSSPDFEDTVHCPNCGACGEAWFFPHKLEGIKFWSVGDHYPNDILMRDKILFVAHFTDFIIDEKNVDKAMELYENHISEKYTPFMVSYVKANFPKK